MMNGHQEKWVKRRPKFKLQRTSPLRKRLERCKERPEISRENYKNDVTGSRTRKLCLDQK